MAGAMTPGVVRLNHAPTGASTFFAENAAGDEAGLALGPLSGAGSLVGKCGWRREAGADLGFAVGCGVAGGEVRLATRGSVGLGSALGCGLAGGEVRLATRGRSATWGSLSGAGSLVGKCGWRREAGVDLGFALGCGAAQDSNGSFAPSADTPTGYSGGPFRGRWCLPVAYTPREGATSRGMAREVRPMVGRVCLQ